MKKEMQQLMTAFIINLIITLPIPVHALTITNLNIDTEANSATFTWKTDEQSNGTVKFGPYNNLNSQATHSNLVTDHSLNVQSLNDDTEYFYEVLSELTDSGVHRFDKEEGQFKTKDLTPPPQVTGLTNTSSTQSSVSLAWQPVQIQDIKHYQIYRDNQIVDNTTSVTYADSSLNPDTQYSYEVAAIDQSDNTGTRSQSLIVKTKEPDLTAPVISEVVLALQAQDSVSITWKTNEEANSTIGYSTKSGSILTQSSATFTLTHSTSLANLELALYDYKITSCDIHDNCANFEDTFFPGQEELILNVSIPEFHNSRELIIKGSTKQFSEVRFFVNDIFKGLQSKTQTGQEGKIDFTLTGLSEGESTIRIEVKDSLGLEFEKTFEISIDTIRPQVEIEPIPELSTDNQLEIKGLASEPLDITFFVSSVSALDEQAPQKVRDFAQDYQRLTPNSVTLAWTLNQENDIDSYIIFRDSIPIGRQKSSPYIDRLANSGVNYMYEIAAIDSNCNLGEKSQVGVTTLEDGRTNLQDPKPIIITCEDLKPQSTLKGVEGAFTQTLTLNQGINEILLNISDISGNNIQLRERTVFDQEAPRFVRTNLREISPTYTRSVEITGQVSEPATVFVFLNDNEAADKQVTTDEEGNFLVEVTLERLTHEFQDTSRQRFQAELESSFENTVTLIARDNVGLNSSPDSAPITYALCGLGSDWDIEIGDPSPDLLIPRLLLEGFSQIGFLVNLKWQGLGENKDATVSNIRIERRRVSQQEEHSYDTDWMSRSPQKRMSNDRRAAYFLLNLQPRSIGGNTSLEKEQNLSRHRKKEKSETDLTGKLGAPSCILPIYGCVVLPLVVEIDYTYFDPYGTALSEAETESNSFLARQTASGGDAIVRRTQRQCFDVVIAIDNTIDFRGALNPLIEGMVDVLNVSINAIDALLGPINDAKKFVFFACAGSWAGLIFKKATEFFTCRPSLPLIGGFDPLTCNPNENGEEGEHCRSCLEARASTLKFWEKSQWVCDRVMCPAAPTIQNYVSQKKESDRQAADLNDDSLRQLSHCTAENLEDIQFNKNEGELKKDIKNYNKIENLELEVREVKEGPGSPKAQYCEAEYLRNYGSTAVLLDELKESFCLTNPTKEEQERKKIDCGGIGKIPRILRTPDEVCRADSDAPLLISTDEGQFLIIDRNRLSGKETDDRPSRIAAYKVTKRTETPILDDGKPKDNWYPLRSGLLTFGQQNDITKENIDNFAIQLEGSTFVKPTELVLEENDCYTIGKDDRSAENLFIDYNCLSGGDCRDKTYQMETDGQIRGGRKNEKWDIFRYDCQFTGNEEKPSEPETGETDEAEQTETDETEQKTINQRRGDSCKDDKIPQAVWEEVCKGGEQYAIDPTSGLIAAVQSACLPATSAYLSQYREVMSVARNCFQTIASTGSGSAGVCKQFMSVYVCDLLYHFIRCVSRKATRGYGAQGGVQGGFFGFLSYMSNSGSNIENSIRGRYGSTNIYKTLFTERKLLHSACGAAFTGDWDLNLNSVLDTQIAAPIKSTCYINGNRRFLGADPSTGGRANFLYNLGVFVVSGGSQGNTPQQSGSRITSGTGTTSSSGLRPISYRVELVCSGDNSCGADYNPGGACDCALFREGGQSGERILPITVGPGFLEQGDALNEEIFYDLARGLPYRFDKARVVMNYVDNNGQQQTDVCETSLPRVGSPPPTHCKFDITDLQYSCYYQFGETADAWFTVAPRLKRSDDRAIIQDETQNNLFVGDKLALEGQIRKLNPSTDDEEPVWLSYRIFTHRAQPPLDLGVIKITKGLINLGADWDQFPDGFPGYIISDSGDSLDKDARTINPFVASDLNIDYDYPTNSGFTVTITPQPKFPDYQFNPVNILFNREDNQYRYSIPSGNCELEEPEGLYNRNSRLTCLINKGTENQMRLTVTGFPQISIDSEYPSSVQLPITQSRTSPTNRPVVPMSIELKLLRDDDGRPSNIVIHHQEEPQERTVTFQVESRRRRLINACNKLGTEPENVPCDCDGDQNTEGANDCRTEPSYCYKLLESATNTCQDVPKCSQREENFQACDCNLDGDNLDDSDCDGDVRKFCVGTRCQGSRPQDRISPDIRFRIVNDIFGVIREGTTRQEIGPVAVQGGAATVQIDLDAQDNGNSGTPDDATGIASIELFVDNEPKQSLPLEKFSVAGSDKIMSNVVPIEINIDQGNRNLKLRATDKAGNPSTVSQEINAWFGNVCGEGGICLDRCEDFDLSPLEGTQGPCQEGSTTYQCCVPK